MRLSTLLLISHGLCAATACAALLAAQYVGGSTLWVSAAVLVAALIATTTFVLSRRLRSGLALLEFVVAHPDEADLPTTGLREFDRTTQSLAAQAGRWEDIAANNREQARDLQAILSVLNRRGGSSETSSAELREVLAGIGQTLYGYLEQTAQNATEISRCTQDIAEAAEVQSNAVVKTSTYVERLYTNIDAISNNVARVQDACTATRDSAVEAKSLVDQAQVGMERIRTHAEASEKRLRGLGDPSRQISSIVGTIGDIAARTDLLALNASIESIRAGEHGRGFAVVADEVRKLAEQAAQATREIAGLIESVQLETQQSIAAVAQERSEVATEVDLVTSAGAILDRICREANEDAARAQEIANTARQQLQLTQDVVLAIEQISNTAKNSRSRAENACWTMQSLAGTRRLFEASVDQLRRCAERRRRDAVDYEQSDALLDEIQRMNEQARPSADVNAAPVAAIPLGDRTSGGAAGRAEV